MAGFKSIGEGGGTHKYRRSSVQEFKRLCIISLLYLSSSDELSEVSPSSLNQKKLFLLDLSSFLTTYPSINFTYMYLE